MAKLTTSFNDLGAKAPTHPWNGIALPQREACEAIECRRGRTEIRASITRNGDCCEARDLTVNALTPSGKTIVEYHFPTIPEGPIALRIAEIMHSGGSVDARLQAIGEVISAEHPHPIACIGTPCELKHVELLTRDIPPFHEYARDPHSIDASFSGEILQNDTLIKVKVSIEPDIRAATIRTSSIHLGSGVRLGSHEFRVRCDEHFWTSEHTRAEIVSELLAKAFRAYDDISALGAESAADLWKKPAIDARLKDGVITPYLTERSTVLPSGARITKEVGDRVACLKIEANGSRSDTASFTWIITSRDALLDQKSEKARALTRATEALCGGTNAERTEAIRALDEVSAKRAAAPHLESILGAPLTRDLRNLPHIEVKASQPRSITDVIALLEGVCPVDVTYRDPGPNRLRPQDPDRLRLGIEPSGGLRLELSTPLGNYVGGVIPAERFSSEHSRAELIKHLVALFHQRRGRDTFRLRTLIETLSVATTTEVNEEPGAAASTLKLPSTASDVGNLAYNTAAEVAKLYEVAGPTVSLSEARVLFGAPASCEISLASPNKKLPTTMKLHVGPSGVLAIELAAKGLSGHEGVVIPFTPPLTPRDDEQHLRNIFQHFKGLSQVETPSTSAAAPKLRETPLFRYLNRLRPAESLFDRVRVFLARSPSFQGLFS